MTSFFENDYKLPSTDNYMKFREGENTFRVLSSAIVGYEYFTKENKPVRSKLPFDETPNIKDGGDVKHFWAFAVWNYADERVQVLELTQKSIMQNMKALIDNKRWGNPQGYDITVSRTGNGLNTEYTLMANPHSVLEEHIAEAWAKSKIDLTELYTGGDPFKPTKAVEIPEIKFSEDTILTDDGSAGLPTAKDGFPM